ncbi:MAG: crAss001_48 related protein [Planctomycetota bacterium]|jgi:hypothetical protein
MKKKDIQEQTPEQAKEAETGDELRNPEQPPAREQDAPQPPEQGPKEPEGTTRLTGSDEAEHDGEHDGIPAYQKRVIVEHIELETKITALSKFIDSPAFMGVDRKEQCRLKNQKQVMQVYASVLKERIDNFKM